MDSDVEGHHRCNGIKIVYGDLHAVKSTKKNGAVLLEAKGDVVD